MTETRQLLVGLTRDELEVRSQELAETIGRKATLEEEARSAAKDYKARIGELTGDISRLSQVVQAKRERRVVGCTWRRNEERRTMELFRDDTEEVIESRAMTTAERQGNLFKLDGKKEKPAAAASGAGSADAGAAEGGSKSESD